MDISQPVARTAFYCCVIRADDAASEHPVCGDRFAEWFLDARVRADLAPVTRFRYPAASNVARHRIIDDLVRAQLAANPQRRIILLGAGFDTRAFRMQGGRWFELDDPALLAFKEERLPAVEAQNRLQRIPVSFQSETPDGYLGTLRGDDEVLVVLEGVSMYLSDAALTSLASTLVQVLPNATLVCDLMSPTFANRFGRRLRGELARMGAVFGQQAGHPRLALERGGLRSTGCVSIAGKGVEYGKLRLWPWLLNTVLRELRDGYAVWTFVRAAD